MAKVSMLIIFLAIFTFGSCLDCYSYNAYHNRPKVITGQTFCTSFYEIATGEVTISGGIRDERSMRTMIAKQGADCRLEKHRMVKGEQYQKFFSCVCFSNMCNFPFAWHEFKSRGYTLLPQIQMTEDLW